LLNSLDVFPQDFQKCVEFHGHVCPGLAIGYAAAKAGMRVLNVGPSEDEEIVAIVENDSCAVDAVQSLLGCTFGKGNLIFRDWGKQVFTFLDRKTLRAVRVSLRADMPGRSERHDLKKRIDSGLASDSDKKRWNELREILTKELISSDPDRYFEVRMENCEIPRLAKIVDTQPCSICGETVMMTKLLEREGRKVCHGCAT